MHVTVTRKIGFDAGHRIPNHQSKCRHPHGHRYELHATVSGPVSTEKGSSAEGMVIDFGDLKKVMMTEIHDEFDHKFLVYRNDALMTKALFDYFTRDTDYVVLEFIPTAENLAQMFFSILDTMLPGGMTLTKVRLYETPNSFADVTRASKNA